MAHYRPETLAQAVLDRVQYWPNAIGRSAGRKLARRYKRRSAADFAGVLARLGPGDICIDLGANQGDFTRAMAATGATVHAYEPDPETFARLEAAVGAMAGVHLYQAAVGRDAGTATLRREKGYDRDRVRASVGSSVRFADARMQDGAGVAVPQHAFRAVLADAGGPVRLVKMDIEGSEIEIMTDLMENGVPPGIGHIFVETHEKQCPADLPAIWALRRWAAGVGAPDINMYWQ